MTDHAVHEFRLLLSDARAVDDYDVADQLFEADFDDIVFGVQAGLSFADVSRAGESLEAVLIDTITTIETVLAPTVVVRVEPDELVTASRIAERVGRTRQSVALLISGERGPGEFPAPVTFVDAQTRVWRWTEVQAWFEAKDIDVEPALTASEGEFLAAVNGVLGARVHLRRYLEGGGELNSAEAVRRLADPAALDDAGPPAELGTADAESSEPLFLQLYGSVDLPLAGALPPETETLLRLAGRVADRARDRAWADKRASLILCAVSAFDAGVILRAHRREAARGCDLIVRAASVRLRQAKGFTSNYERYPLAPSPGSLWPEHMEPFHAPHHSRAPFATCGCTAAPALYGFAAPQTMPDWGLDALLTGPRWHATDVDPPHDVNPYIALAANAGSADYNSTATRATSFALITGLAAVASEWMSADDRQALSELMDHVRSELLGQP